MTCVILMTAQVAGVNSWADDGEQEKEVVPPRSSPILMINVSQVDVMLTNLASAFQSVGRDDMVDVMQGVLNRAGNLDGVDRKRSMGMALFLPETLPPRPVGVFYVPLTDIDSLVETMQLGPMKVQKVADADDRFEIIGRRQTRELVVRDGYAFISQEESFLDADVTLLSKLAPELASKYDMSVTFRPRSIPPILLDLFLGYLEGQTQGQLQQRDGEPLSEYIARRANGLSMLELLHQVLQDGEQLTLGLKADPETGGARIELIVDAKPDSEFAQYLDDLAGRPSSFAALFRSDEPLSVSASWMLANRQKKAFRDLARALAIGLQRRLYPEEAGAEAGARERIPGSSETAPAIHPTIERLIRPVTATIDAGHVDFFAQMRPTDGNRFVLIGGLHLVGGETFGTGLREVLTQLQSRDPDSQMELNVDRHEDVVFHRLGGDAVREQDRRIYGDNSSIYVGSSRRTFWFAIGGPDALKELKSAMDTLLNAEGEPPSREHSMPFQIVLRAAQWLRLPEQDDPRERDRRELSGKAFSPDNDTLRVEVRPTETGVVIRANLDAGFVRLLALALSMRYDDSRL